jgi:hypothetical protein
MLVIIYSMLLLFILYIGGFNNGILEVFELGIVGLDFGADLNILFVEFEREYHQS